MIIAVCSELWRSSHTLVVGVICIASVSMTIQNNFNRILHLLEQANELTSAKWLPEVLADL